MNHPAILMVWFIAALAGWLGMARWRDYLTDREKPAPRDVTVITEDGPGSTAAARGPGPGGGSGALSQLAARLSALPENRLSAERDKVKTWPPGAERALALALIDARRGMDGIAPADDPFDPLGSDAEPAVNRFQDLAAMLQRGTIPDPDGPLSEWAALDPAAARAAVLAMPEGEERAMAADTIAGVIGKSDPAAAMEFARQAGGEFQGTGVAKAWLALMKTEPFANAGAMPPPLTPEQSEGLAAALGSLVEKQQEPYSGREISFSDEDLRKLSKVILTTLKPGPQRLRLVEKIAERDYRLLEFDMDSGQEPEKAVYAAKHLAEGILAAPDTAVYSFWLGQANAFPVTSVKTLETAAPRLLPRLAWSGHVAEAVQLLGRIQDADVRRTSLEAMLPAWMDADPAAARAAFEAAPLTVLERERWDRHPAFLLHSASGK